MPIIRKYNGITVSPPSTGIVNNFTTTNITGTVAETILSTILIPANTFKLYDIIDIESRLRKTNSNATATIRIRTNTSQSLTGAVLIGTFTSTLASDSYIPIFRRIVIKDLTSGTEFADATSTNIVNDLNNNTLVYSNTAIDWTVNQYIILTGQLGSTSDIMNLMFIILKCIEGR